MRTVLCKDLHAPFFTCQWKGAKNATHHEAASQGARDGAVINNYLRWLYSTADPTSEPSLQDTCHFSATCDFNTLILFVHWTSIHSTGLRYHMREIDEFQLKKSVSVAGFRSFMRNLQDLAVGDCLINIKTAIPKVKAALLRGPAKVPPTPPESVVLLRSESGSLATPSIASAPPSVASEWAPEWAVALTPNVSSDSVSKKRKIGEASVASVVDEDGVEHGQNDVQKWHSL